MSNRRPSRAPRALSAQLRSLLPVLLITLLALYRAAPSLGLASLFRPFLDDVPFAAYQEQRVALGLDLSGGMDAVYRVESEDPRLVRAAADVLRSRLALDGISGAEVRLQGEDQLRAQVPCQDEERCQELREVLEATDLLALHEVRAVAPSPVLLPPQTGTRALPGTLPPGTPGAPPWYLLDEAPALTGDALEEVRIGFAPLTGQPVLELDFDAAGTEAFAALSRRARGRQVAVVLGGEVVTAPVMEQEIPHGHAQLRGHFEIGEARRLVRLLQAGSLPAPLTRLSRSVVGPTLGAEAVVQSSRAALGGLAAVGGWMALCYGRAGVVASLGLGLNLVLQVAALELTGAALTLPGLAGVVLTVGMAVDANVLAFERIREELTAGRSRSSARIVGHRKALSAILDSNLTTLLTGVVLFFFGSGPVRGFAITLGLGLLCSMATALWMVPRLLETGDLTP